MPSAALKFLHISSNSSPQAEQLHYSCPSTLVRALRTPASFNSTSSSLALPATQKTALNPTKQCEADLQSLLVH